MNNEQPLNMMFFYSRGKSRTYPAKNLNHAISYITKAVARTKTIVYVKAVDDKGNILYQKGDPSRAKDLDVVKDSHWEIDAVPPGAEGFVYKITVGDYYYIGKKNFWTYSRGKKAGESGWRMYQGSSEVLHEMINSEEHPVKYEMLHICGCKAELNYVEVEEQVRHNVIRDPMAINQQLGDTKIRHSSGWLSN